MDGVEQQALREHTTPQRGIQTAPISQGLPRTKAVADMIMATRVSQSSENKLPTSLPVEQTTEVQYAGQGYTGTIPTEMGVSDDGFGNKLAVHLSS